MSSQKGAKTGSRWNFLQQAVASVESGLDRILADEEDARRASSQQSANGAVQPSRGSSELSRTDNATRANDRLQERLALAMARKGSSKPETPSATPPPASRVSTPVPSTSGAEEPKVDQDKNVQDAEEEPRSTEDAREPDRAELPETAGTENGAKRSDTTVVPQELETTAATAEVAPPDPRHASQSLQTDVEPIPTDGSERVPPIAQEDVPEKTSVEFERSDNTEQSSLQEDMNAYVERIDALQAKLQYLSQEAATSARQAAAAVEAGSVERKVLEKDEKIALLMQEGEKLAKSEMKHLSTIKKLRMHSTTAQKEHEVMKARAEKVESTLRTIEERARRAEAVARRAEETLAAQSSATRDYDAVTRERNALATTLTEIKSQLARATSRAEAAEAKANSGQLEKEQSRAAELQDDLTSARLEREIAEEKLNKEVEDLKAALEREKNQARAMETEMLGEQASLESKLESLRSKAEAAYSEDQGDAHAKLLRQIETLQSQYAAATQNWQTVEGTLLARISDLENQRNDAIAREADLRKKLKDAQTKVRNSERELQDTQDRYAEVQRHQGQVEDELQRSRRQIQQVKDELAAANKQFEDHKVQAERDLQKRIEEERAKWVTSTQVARMESPIQTLLGGSRKSSTLDMGHLMSPTVSERPHSRKSSAIHIADFSAVSRQYSLASPSQKGFSTANGAIPETPSIVTSADQDEYFNNIPPTPASHVQPMSNRGLNDLISTSTVGAGPSVQLVERMSANVRRLESEKAASKDELARLSTQRDEARQEVVNLMREAEQKRLVDDRLKAVEKEHADVTQRYQTTLEILGEKSEQVEELKADILDVKQMYRQLADQMGKT